VSWEEGVIVREAFLVPKFCLGLLGRGSASCVTKDAGGT